jgi:radical SAM protein with 4Fe4S-binding SPASM domain
MVTDARFSDLRVLRWTDRIKDSLDGKRVGPIRANLDLTNLCNDNCPWCEPLQFRKETIADRKHTIETATAIEVLTDLADMGCKTVNFSGGGEPLVHTDFGQILRFAVRQGMRTWVVTNGFYLDKWLPDLEYAHHVRISLDASNEAEHREMHGSKEGSFEKVCQNIRALCKRRDKLRRSPARPEVGIAYIVADCNSDADSFGNLLAFAEDAGVDFIHFRPLSEETPQRFTEDWEDVMRVIDGFRPAFKGVQFFPMSKRWKDVFHQREFDRCYSSETIAVIAANGEVNPCCDRRDLSFGSVYEQRFKDIWLGARHQRMADLIAPALCTRCLQCGYNRAVQNYVVENQALPELM